VNILNIESRPAPDRIWEYLFFMDLDGHREEERVGGCLREMAGRTAFIKHLGSYPKGDLP
jgi:chorismate mutase/prephenate dehydratase